MASADGEYKQRQETWVLVPVPGAAIVAFVFDIFGYHLEVEK